MAMDVGQNGKASYNWKFNSLSFDPRVNDFGNNRIRGGKESTPSLSSPRILIGAIFCLKERESASSLLYEFI